MKEIIREITTQKRVFIANDGKEFGTEYECKAHEEEISKAELLIKRQRIFGDPITDEATQWMGSCTEWYPIRIENENDLLDFITVIEKDERLYDDYGNFGEKFVEEVLSVLKSGKAFEMLISVMDDGYTSRYGRNYICGSDPNTNASYKKWYENAMKSISNMAKLAKEMKKYVTLTEVEAN